MSTPSYKGQGQPIVGNGGSWLGRLGSIFAPSTPMYAGAGQPVIANGGLLNTTPIYAVAPATAQPTSQPSATQTASQQMPVTASQGDCGCDGAQIDEGEQALMACPIDPGALASGHIAIVIPRMPATDEQ